MGRDNMSKRDLEKKISLLDNKLESGLSGKKYEQFIVDILSKEITDLDHATAMADHIIFYTLKVEIDFNDQKVSKSTYETISSKRKRIVKIVRRELSKFSAQ
jgi:hypothetical protein